MLFLGVVYARMLNKRAVALNSEEIAKDLFEERSSIYSDKPQRWFTKREPSVYTLRLSKC
jgi:hypothetical protein